MSQTYSPAETVHSIDDKTKDLLLRSKIHSCHNAGAFSPVQTFSKKEGSIRQGLLEDRIPDALGNPHPPLTEPGSIGLLINARRNCSPTAHTVLEASNVSVSCVTTSAPTSSRTMAVTTSADGSGDAWLIYTLRKRATGKAGR